MSPSGTGPALSGATYSVHLLPCAVLAALTGLSRYLCRSHLLYDIDSVNFALAMDHFDPRLHQPHPPGYFLYVCTARAINALFHDANTALVSLSIIASCAAVVLIYMLACTWSGRRAGIFAGLIFVFSPLCWFHGTVGLTYIVETFFSALTGYLCWRGHSGEKSLLVAAAGVLGIAAGFRPSSLLFLGPLWLFSLYRAGARVKAMAISALTVTLLAWWIPMTQASGGMRAYLAALLALWKLVPAKQSFRTPYVAMVLARGFTIVGIAALCFGCALFLALRRGGRGDRFGVAQRTFASVWIAPGLLFFTFVFLNFVNSGYILILTPPVFAWLGHRASTWWSPPSAHTVFKLGLAAAAVAVNIGIFLLAPVYCSFREVRRFEAQLNNTVAAVRQRFKPAETMIVGFDSHFLGYRHAGYYLPEFLTVQYPAIPLPEGKRIFALEGRKTILLTVVPVSQFRQFAILPLPTGSDYQKYMDQQLAHFPAGTLHADGGQPRFLIGSPSDLKYLFSPAGESR